MNITHHMNNKHGNNKHEYYTVIYLAQLQAIT